MNLKKILTIRIEALLLLSGVGVISVSLAALQDLSVESNFLHYLPLVVGILLFVLGVQGLRSHDSPSVFLYPLEKISAFFDVYPSQIIYLLLSVVFVSITFMMDGNDAVMNNFALAVVSWILAIVFVVLGFWRSEEDFPKLGRETIQWMAFFAVISWVIHGVYLEGAPHILTGDEGSAAQSAMSYAAGDVNNIFGVGWFSFPAMFFYIESFSVNLFGNTIFAARLPAVLISGVSVAFTYLLGKKMFNHYTGLATAIFLSGFHYFNHFSRIALNNIWDSLWLVLTIGGLWYGWTHKKRFGFLLGGVAMGLAQYFYASSRLLFALVPVLIIIFLFLDRQGFKENWKNIVMMFFIVFLVFSPLIAFYINHPQEFMAPLNRVGLTSEWLLNEVELTGRSQINILGELLQKSTSIIFDGASAQWYDSGEPLLRTVSAAVFFIGLLFLMMQINELRSWVLFIWILAFTTSGMFSLPTPALQRYVALSPALALVVGFALIEFADLLGKIWQDRKQLIIYGALLVSVLLAADDVRFYFFDYIPSSNLGGPNTRVANHLAEYLIDNYSEEDHVEVGFFGIPRMGYYSISTLPYLADHVQGWDMNHIWGSPENPEVGGDVQIYVFLPFANQEANLASAQKMIPGGELTAFRWFNPDVGDEEILYWAYVVSD